MSHILVKSPKSLFILPSLAVWLKGSHTLWGFHSLHFHSDRPNQWITVRTDEVIQEEDLAHGPGMRSHLNKKLVILLLITSKTCISWISEVIFLNISSQFLFPSYHLVTRWTGWWKLPWSWGKVWKTINYTHGCWYCVVSASDTRQP